MANIVQYKLSTNEWIVGELQETLEVGDSVTLSKVFTLHVVPNGPNSFQIAMVPFDPANPEGTHKIRRDKIVAEPTGLTKELVHAYVQRTSAIEIVPGLEGLKR